MFANLPHKLAPFGLLGDEAKLAFPVQPGGIAKLASVRVRIDFLGDCAYSGGVKQNIPENDGYWEQVREETPEYAL
jgi:hypothetical protein